MAPPRKSPGAAGTAARASTNTACTKPKYSTWPTTAPAALRVCDNCRHFRRVPDVLGGLRSGGRCHLGPTHQDENGSDVRPVLDALARRPCFQRRPQTGGRKHARRKE